MRSSLHPSICEESYNKEEGEEEGEGGDPFSSFYWWRPIPNLDAKASESSPKARVVRELERLAAAAHESFDGLRHRLVTYKAGDLWFPAGGLERKDTDIPPVITILLLGFSGCGKSSVVNLMYSVLGLTGIVPFAQTSPPAGRDGRTQFLEEHNVLRSMRNGFCVFDSRGLEYDRLDKGLDEVAEWMEEGVRHCQPCRSSGRSEASPVGSSSAAVKRFVRRRVNCVMVVVSLSQIHQSLNGGDFRPLHAARELFHAHSINSSCNDTPILLLTHGDELVPEDRIEARVRLCECVGVSETAGVYDVTCHDEHGPMAVEEMDPVAAYAVSESIYRALLVADRCHPPKPGPKEWLVLVLTWAMWGLSSLFAFLADFCSSFARRGHKLRLE